MGVLSSIWYFFNYNIFQKPAFFVGVLVLVGYALLKRKPYDIFAGFVKAVVGYMILSIGSGGLVSTFRPILLGLATRFNMTAAVIDPYYGQIAAEHMIQQVGRTVSIGMSVLVVGFFVNILLVAFKKVTKVRSLMITGHTMICQCSLVTWLVLFAFPNASDISIIVLTGILMGFYWGCTTNVTVEACQNLTDGAGFVVGHNQMFGVWFADRFGEKIGGKNAKKVEDIELPGWLQVFKDNTVSSALIMLVFMGVLMTILGRDVLSQVDSAYNPNQNFIFYVIETSFKFSVYMQILLVGVRMFVAELSQAFHGISAKLLPGSAAGIDCAATYGFIPTNAVMFGFLCGLAGQILVILGLVVFKSPILVITGFVPVFFDNATIAGFANKRGGVKATVIITFLSGVIQASIGAFAAYHFLTATFGGWYGNFDFEFFWPWAGLAMQYLQYAGYAIVIGVLVLIPQLQYIRNKKYYFEILTDWEGVKAKRAAEAAAVAKE